jgi:hypothetical protein
MSIFPLPSELDCHVIESTAFRVKDIKTIMSVSHGMRELMRSCLTEIAPPSYGAIVLNPLSVDFISQFTRLKYCDYPIGINNFSDLEKLYKHPHIKRAIIDFMPFEEFVNSQLIERGDDYDGIEIVVTRKDNTKQAMKFLHITDFIVVFLKMYKDYSINKLRNIEFKFRLINTTITIKEHYLCINDYNANISAIINYNDMIKGINKFNKLDYYAGPFLSELDDLTLETLIIQIIDSDGILDIFVDNNDNIVEYRIDWQKLNPILSKPSLTHFGMTIGQSNMLMESNLINDYSLIAYLERNNIVLKNLLTYDFPVSNNDLRILPSVMPNVKLPLIDFELSSEDIRFIKTSFTNVRVSMFYDYEYPTIIPIVDFNTSYISHPC